MRSIADKVTLETASLEFDTEIETGLLGGSLYKESELNLLLEGQCNHSAELMCFTVNNELWGFATAWLDYDSLEATI